jgi:serine/threonine-protein kinase
MNGSGSPQTQLWRDVFEAADRALELDPRDRRAFIEQLLEENPPLGAELQALIESGENPSVLEHPASSFAAPFLDAGTDSPDGVTSPNGDTPIFGAYRVRREIGSGGMGTVYLAERADDQFRKDVALKVLPRWSAGGGRRFQRFLEERQILAQLDHPGIARLLDGGVTADGTPWFAMEYIAGEPIDRYCERREISVEERLKLFCDVCSAVEYAHRNLVVHRDLKPSNILVAPDGRVALLDFGIARLLADQDALAGEATMTVDRLLTPLYSSPEQIRGEQVSTAADVYALGVLLHVLLTGTNPYRLAKLDSYEVARAVLEEEPERPSASAARTGKSPHLVRRLRGDLDAIVLKAMCKEPGKRYASVEQLETDVKRYLAGLPVLAQPESKPYVLGKFVKRHRMAVALTTAATLLLIGFAAVMAVQRSHIRAQAQRITRERDRAEAVGQNFMAIFRNLTPGDSGITAREILDSATSRINLELLNFPDQRARLIFGMAQAYHRIDQESRAAGLLELSLDLRKSLKPPPRLDIAENLDLLGEVHLAQGNVARADSDYTAALALRRGNLPPQDLRLARTLVGLSAARRAEGKFAEAEGFAREAIRIESAGGPVARADLARGTSTLAAAIAAKGEYQEAARIYRDALSLYREVRPEEHPDVETAALDLATALNAAGDHRGADSLMRYELALHRRIVTAAVLTGTARGSSPTLAADAPETVGAIVNSAFAQSSPPKSSAPATATGRSLIAFVSDRDGPDAIGNLGNQEIYVMNPDGSGQRRLTYEKSADYAPAFSADGKRIAFTSQRAGGFEIFLMNADGSDQRQLTHFAELGRGAIAPAWSPDGKHIAFVTRLPPIAIYVINVDGTGVKRVSDDGGGTSNPSWSPDGRRIAFNSRRSGKQQIYVMDADGQNLSRLTTDDATNRVPVWSPNGKQIAFESDRDGQSRIYIMNADGSNQHRVSSPPGADGHPSWSPDGKQIVFHKTVLGHGQVYVMDADGGHLQRLTALSSVAFNAYPTWSPLLR